jgi:hypothetical protein
MRKISILLISILLHFGNFVSAQYNWNTLRVGGGGAVPGMIAHPQVQNLYYARTDVGNCYRWDATNQKWIGLLNSVKNSEWWRGAAADIAIDPSDASGNTVYITVGKYDWAGTGGVWKSTDRGANWTRLSLNITVGSNQDQTVGQRMAINPSNSSVVILTTKANGTQRSTNGGASWSQVSTTNGRFVVFDPTNNNIVYLGHATGVMKSTDGGATFSAMSGAPSAVRRASMHSNGVMYVSTETSVNKWNGSTWTAITPGGTSVYGAIAVNPQNVNQVIVSKHAWSHGLDMYRTTDGGANWTLITKSRDVTEVPWSPSYHFASATFEFCWDPFNQTHVWFSDWYNTWETNDPWASTVVWKARSVGHEEMVTVGALACPPSGNNLLLSGVADIGGFDHTSLTNPPSQNIWGAGVGSGYLTTGVAFQETNTNYIARVGRNGWNGSGWGAYSTNGGTSYTAFSSAAGAGGRIAISANSTTLVWATQGGKVYYSTNNGSSWTVTSGLPTGGIIGGSDVFTYIQPLAADKVNGNTFYAYNAGKFYKSTNGSSYTAVNSSLPSLGTTEYVNIVTVPGQAGTIYLGLNGSGLKRSTDGGTTWSSISAVSTARLVAVGKASGSNPAVYVFGTVNSVEGVFRSDDNGSTWTEISTDAYEMGMEPNIMAADRNVFGRVFIGTNGNGVFVGEPNSVPDTQAPTTPTGLSATPASTSVTLSWTASTDNLVVTGYKVYNGTTYVATSTSTNYTVTGLSASTAFTFGVSAIDAAGNESAKATISTTTSTLDTQAPTTPTGLSATPASTSVSLSWTASTDNVGVTGYKVYNGASYVATSTATTYNVSGLSASTAFTFGVSAIDASGNESAQATVSTTTLAVTNLILNPGFENDLTNWSVPTQTVTIVTSPVHGGSKAAKLGAKNTAWSTVQQNISGLTPGATYTIGLWGRVNASGQTMNFVVKNGSTDLITPLAFTTTTYTQKTATFTVPSGVTSVIIQAYMPTRNQYGFADDFTMNEGSTLKSVTLSNSLHRTEQNVHVYPNPVQRGEFLNIKSVEQNSIVQLFDLQGRTLINKKYTTVETINTSRLTKGVYLLKIIQENGNVTSQKINIK